MPPHQIKGTPGEYMSMVSGLNTFKIAKPKAKIRERAKFNPKRRQEVKQMRAERACLRCSLLKVRCFPGDICTNCKSLALHAHENVMLSFSGCIRTRLTEVSVFEHAIPPPGMRDAVLLKTKGLAFKSITLNFASQVAWNITALVNELVDWLSGPQVSTIVPSKVGTLSSPNFMAIVEPYIGVNHMLSFQRMLYAESLAYIKPATENQQHFTTLELRQIGGTAGHNFLTFLDKRLRPESLKDCSHESLQSIFLLVVGTILAVGYASQVDFDLQPVNKQFDNISKVNETQFKAMQDHLCQILAHYVVYLGSRLNLPIRSQVSRFILEAASARWYKEGNFKWRNASECDFDPTTDLHLNGIGLTSSGQFFGQGNHQRPAMACGATPEDFSYWDKKFGTMSINTCAAKFNGDLVGYWSYGEVRDRAERDDEDRIFDPNIKSKGRQNKDKEVAFLV